MELVGGGSDINGAYPVFFLCEFRNYFCSVIKVRVIREELFLSIENVISQCRQFGVNFTPPKFQEDVTERLGAREQYTNLGSCTTKILYLPKAPLHFLETLAV